MTFFIVDLFYFKRDLYKEQAGMGGGGRNEIILLK